MIRVLLAMAVLLLAVTAIAALGERWSVTAGAQRWLAGVGVPPLATGIAGGCLLIGCLAFSLLTRGRRKPMLGPMAGRTPRITMDTLSIRLDAPLGRLRKTTELLEQAGAGEEDPVGVVAELLSAGFSVGASDVHVAPEREEVRVSMRVDGVMHDVGSIPAEQGPALVNRLKVLADLAIHLRATPQDGAIVFDSDDHQVRVSTLPTNHGEKVVLRLAVNDETRYQLDSLGLSERERTLLETFLGRDHGVIYLTGPTGSGKTTTLYASLQHIRQRRGETANIATLEDPIEVDLARVAQTQVDPGSGLTFAVGLRALLRQDPDVIMVGEIRDPETAETATRAALTGHLILTTVHADSTAAVFTRLRQLGVDAFQMASASVAVMSQRLVLRNCLECAEPRELEAGLREQLALLGAVDRGTFQEGAGCRVCRGTGRAGRVALFEILPVTRSLRELLMADRPAPELAEAAEAEGMVPLAQRAWSLAESGIVPAEELIRLLSM